MTKKNVKKNVMKKTASKKLFVASASIDQRKRLLASVAGSIAAGMVTAPSPSISTPSSMAIAAVDIAEEILKAAGIPSDESSAEAVSPSDDARVGAAS